MKADFSVNERSYSVEISEGELLLDLLRKLGYSSVREGCGVGACGSCTVLVEHKSVSACLVLASRCAGKEILTCEGLGDDNAVVEAFVDAGALQCGYCIPGFVMMATELLAENASPDRREIADHLEGNICRCGTYPEILSAMASLSGKV